MYVGGDRRVGTGFIDIEQPWTLNHENLAADITIISGVSQACHGHATAVLDGGVAEDDANEGAGCSIPRLSR